MTRNINEEFKEIDIHNITNNEYWELLKESAYKINFYEDSKIILRYLDRKEYFFDCGSGNLRFDKEILLFKLFKYGLIEIDLYGFKFDIDSFEGKEFYKFMDKYSRASKEYHSYDDGKIEYDIKGIIENEYNKFINHIFKNIELEYKKIQSDDLDFEDLYPEDVEEILYDRFLMIAYLNSSKVFFEKLNKLIVIENNNDEILNDIITKLNNSKEEIKFDLKTIIDEKQGIIYFLLKYLEEKGKLEIISIKIEGNEVVYKIKSLISEYSNILFANFSYQYEGNNLSYQDQKLYNNGIEIHKFKDEYSSLNLFFKHMFSKQEKEAVNFKEIYSILDNTYHGNSTLKESQDKKVRNIIDTGNKIIKIFFLEKGGIQSQVYWKN